MGAVRRCEGCLSSGALPPPAARPLGGLSGSFTHVLWVRVYGRGAPALSLWLACPAKGLLAAALVGGGLGGVAFHRCEGRLVSGAVSPPAARPLGRAARVPRPVFPGCGRCGRGDPASAPQRALLRAVVARCGGGGRAPLVGGAFRRYEGRLNSGARLPPAPRPLDGLSGSATHALCARACGCGGPALSLWLACPVEGCVPRRWWEAVPAGFTFHRCEGRLVSGAVSPLAARPLGPAARVPRPVFLRCGWCRREDPAPVPQRALLRAVVARCGGGGRASLGEMPCAVVRGV